MSESLAGRLSRLGSSGYIKVCPLWAGGLAAASSVWPSATSEDEPELDDPPPQGRKAKPAALREED